MNPRSLSTVALQPLIPQSIKHSQGCPISVQDPALALVKHHTVRDCPSLQFVQVSLQGLSVLEGVDNSSQFSVIGKLAECSIESYVQVVNEDGEECRAEDGALQNPTRDQCQPDATLITVTICS